MIKKSASKLLSLVKATVLGQDPSANQLKLFTITYKIFDDSIAKEVVLIYFVCYCNDVNGLTYL